MLGVFKRGGMLAMLIDQDTRVQGAFVPFFGKPAHTPTAAATLALRAEAPVVIGTIQRSETRHQLRFKVLEFTPTGDRDADVVALTAAMSHELEQAISRTPEQWVWMHQRWKKQQS